MMIHFSKYQGTGNDFIIIDNRNGQINLNTEQIAFLCDRRFGIGADGLMLLNAHEAYDFEMKYYNADGKESSMCGNGGRCLTQFAKDVGIVKEKYTFIAIDGPHEACFDKAGWVNLKMIDVSGVLPYEQFVTLNTGSPHLIYPCNNIESVNVFEEGRKIRNNNNFKAQGINVNFVEQVSTNELKVRTYERGVEDETFSCGTGVTAAALAFSHPLIGKQIIHIQTKGGNLRIEFNKIDNQNFSDIWLCGPATFVFSGQINI